MNRIKILINTSLIISTLIVWQCSSNIIMPKSHGDIIEDRLKELNEREDIIQAMKKEYIAINHKDSLIHYLENKPKSAIQLFSEQLRDEEYIRDHYLDFYYFGRLMIKYYSSDTTISARNYKKDIYKAITKEDYPYSYMHYTHYMMILRKCDDYIESNNVLKSALNYYPDTYWLHFYLAANYYRLNDYKNAKSYYESFMKFVGDLNEIDIYHRSHFFNEYTKVAMAEKDTLSAIDTYIKAYKVDQYLNYLWDAYALFTKDIGLLTNYYDDIDMFMKADTIDADTQIMGGYILAKYESDINKDYHKAINICEEQLANCTESDIKLLEYLLKVKLSWYNYKVNDLQTASYLLEESKKLQTENEFYWVYIYYGIIQFALNNPDETITYLNKAILTAEKQNELIDDEYIEELNSLTFSDDYSDKMNMIYMNIQNVNNNVTKKITMPEIIVK